MIPFTQFLLPNGQKRQGNFERPKHIEDMADFCINKGARFTAEMLQTGHISLACEFEDEDITIELSFNGKEIMDSIDKLVTESFEIIKGN